MFICQNFRWASHGKGEYSAVLLVEALKFADVNLSAAYKADPSAGTLSLILSMYRRSSTNNNRSDIQPLSNDPVVGCPVDQDTG